MYEGVVFLVPFLYTFLTVVSSTIFLVSRNFLSGSISFKYLSAADYILLILPESISLTYFLILDTETFFVFPSSSMKLTLNPCFTSLFK